MLREWVLIAKITVIGIILALMYGCTTTATNPTPVVYVHTTVDKTVSIPEGLLTVHPASTPPSQEQFLPIVPKSQAQAVEVLKVQRNLLLEYSQALLADIKINQDKLLAIKSLMGKSKEDGHE